MYGSNVVAAKGEMRRAIGNWVASSSPMEQPMQDPTGEGSRHLKKELLREGGWGSGEVRNGLNYSLLGYLCCPQAAAAALWQGLGEGRI